MEDQGDVTGLLLAVTEGQPGAQEALIPVIYDELHRRAAAMMRRESEGHTLQATALVHEAFLRLMDQDRVTWHGRAHFFAIASQCMRRVLVDHARGRLRDKRGGGQVRLSIEDGMPLTIQRDADVVALDDALRDLAEEDARQAEIVVMRFFGGLSVEEVAEALGVSKRTVEAEWTMIKAWLRRALTDG